MSSAKQLRSEHKLRISAAQQPTVLERILQVTRYRGFSVTDMTMFPERDTDQMAIEMTVSSEHPVTQLQLQLSKLFDINGIEIQDTALAQCRA